MNSAASDPEETGDGAAPRISLGKGRALVPVPPAAAKPDVLAGFGRSYGYVAAGVALVMGIGFVAGTQAFASRPQPVATAQAGPPPDTTMDVLYRVQGEVRSLKASLDGLKASAEDARQVDTIRGLKRSVDTLKQDLEGVKAASANAVGQLGAKIDRLDRDPGPKLNEIAARLDKLDREPDAKVADAKLAQVTARLDRVERQVSSPDVTGSVPAQTVGPAQAKPAVQPQHAPPPPAAAAPAGAAVTAVPPARPDSAPRAEAAKPEPAKPDVVAKADPQPRAVEVAAKPATVDGWLLRDVYGGVALVEGRSGGLREVAPGEHVPGVGEIRSIERRGRGWVVVTSRGLIQADNRW